MSDLDTLYRELILDHSKHPQHFGLAAEEGAHATSHQVNPTCGDEITLRARVETETVTDSMAPNSEKRSLMLPHGIPLVGKGEQGRSVLLGAIVLVPGERPLSPLSPHVPVVIARSLRTKPATGNEGPSASLQASGTE